MVRKPKEEYCPGGVSPDRPLPVAALEAQRGGAPESGASASNHKVVDIMILYSEAAGERYILRDGAIEPTINNSIDYLNTVFRNGQLDVVARLAHLQQAPASLSVEGGGSAVLNRLRLNQEIRDLRIEHNADLVHLFTTAEVRNVCGIAYLLQKGQTWRSFWPLGYGVTVMQGCGDETFAHEIGHNLGANHDPPNAGSNWEDADRRNNVSVQPYAFGHTWFTGQHPNIPDRDTIMSYGSGRPEPWFSTVRVQPRIEGRSAVFGIANECENERALRGTVGTVARLSDGLPRGTDPDPDPEPPPPPPGAGPTAPGNLTGMSTGPTSVRLSWVDRSDDETGFEVQLRQRGRGWRTDSTVSANTTTADVTGLTPGGRYDFRVRAVNDAGRSASDLVTIVLPSTDFTDCVPSEPLIAFDHGFTVSMCVEYLEGGVGPIVKEDAKNYELESRESGLLYFFDRDNAEVLVKVLDACVVNGFRWVFVAPVTDLAFNLYVDETATGERWMHRNPRGGVTAAPKGDVTAFPCAAGAAGAAVTAARTADGPGGVNLVDAGLAPASVADAINAGEAPDCEPQPVLTLNRGHQVSMCVEFLKDGAPESAEVKDYGLDSEQSGLLYFFDRNNAEVLIKVLDACGVNGYRWVFVAPVTDLAFNLVVTPDGGEPWTHGNSLGQTAATAGDTKAFACSP